MPTKNPYGKATKTETPYATYAGNGWEYRILKLYQSPENAAKNTHATALLATKSPYTYGSFELGDGYLSEISGELIQGPDILKECGRR